MVGYFRISFTSVRSSARSRLCAWMSGMCCDSWAWQVFARPSPPDAIPDHVTAVISRVLAAITS
jgi:hypothetical protein